MAADAPPSPDPADPPPAPGAGSPAGGPPGSTGRRLLVRGVVVGVVVVVLAVAGCGARGGGGSSSGSDPQPGSSPGAAGSRDGSEDAEDADGPSTDVGPSGSDGGEVAPVPPAGDVSGDLVSCPAPTVRVGTADELQAALDGAEPGASIVLADGTYTGAFVAKRSGTDSQPIFLCGGPGAVLDGDGPTKGYVLHLDGVAHWRVVGFTVRNGQKGVVADHVSNSVIQQLTVEDIGDEGIHLRSASTSNAVLGNTVRRTGLRRDKFGEGIYVGSAVSNWPKYSGGEPDRSDGNLVKGNTISATSAESIDVKEGTTGGRVVGNSMDGTGMTGADSLVDVKGSGWLIEGNVGTHAVKDAMQTHRILEGWGTENVFRNNVVDIDGDPEGVHFSIHDPEVTDNVVACDNRTGDGRPVTSNVPCL